MSTPEAIMPHNIDSTMISCARSCMEKFRLEFIYGLRPAGLSIDLHAGACFATAVEHTRKAFFQKGKALDASLIEGHAAFAVAWGNFEIPAHKKTYKTFDRTWAAVEEYFTQWPPATDHLQPYFVNGKPTFEFTFAIPLEPVAALPQDGTRYASYNPDDHPGQFPLHPNGEPWLYSGRLDMLGTWKGKFPVFEDDKTQGGSISTGWSEKWNLRSQFIGYTWACQQSGLDLDSGVVRGIAIQQTQIATNEALKTYNAHIVAKWHDQLRRDLWRIRQAWDSGYFDLNLADACTTFGNCIFMNMCSATPEMRENWFNDYEVRRWNPLHKNPVGTLGAAA
jgi:hypothetical protein